MPWRSEPRRVRVEKFRFSFHFSHFFSVGFPVETEKKLQNQRPFLSSFSLDFFIVSKKPFEQGQSS